MIGLECEFVISVVVTVARIAIPGLFEELDECEEVARLGIFHGLIEGSVVAINVALPHCVLALAQDGHQDDHVLKCPQEE
jgi:hypothetical protein